MNGYLIPANTKKGTLILGIFNPFDLILFGSGVLVTVIFLAILPLASTFVTILIILPALITGLLVMPIPYYHNTLTVILELIGYLTNRRTFYWKGWCIIDEFKEQKNNK